MSDLPCPVSLAQIFTADFRPFDDGDVQSFAGVEHDGFVAELTGDNGEELTVVLDHGPSSVLQVHYCSDDGQDQACWSVELPCFTQIV